MNPLRFLKNPLIVGGILLILDIECHDYILHLSTRQFDPDALLDCHLAFLRGAFFIVGALLLANLRERSLALTVRSLWLPLKGSFRVDLFYHLNVVQVRMPASRERGEDILPLAARRTICPLL